MDTTDNHCVSNSALVGFHNTRTESVRHVHVLPASLPGVDEPLRRRNELPTDEFEIIVVVLRTFAISQVPCRQRVFGMSSSCQIVCLPLITGVFVARTDV